jgi:hypothetical protein
MLEELVRDALQAHARSESEDPEAHICALEQQLEQHDRTRRATGALTSGVGISLLLFFAWLLMPHPVPADDSLHVSGGAARTPSMPTLAPNADGLETGSSTTRPPLRDALVTMPPHDPSPPPTRGPEHGPPATNTTADVAPPRSDPIAPRASPPAVVNPDAGPDASVVVSAPTTVGTTVPVTTSAPTPTTGPTATSLTATAVELGSGNFAVSGTGTPGKRIYIVLAQYDDASTYVADSGDWGPVVVHAAEMPLDGMPANVFVMSNSTGEFEVVPVTRTR